MRLTILVGALLLISSSALAQPAAAPTPAAKPSAWDPDVFPISFWDGPPEEFTTPERYQQIADAGFTYAMPRMSSGVTTEMNKKALEYCQLAGIKAFIRDGRMPMGFGPNGEGKERADAIIADYASHPAFAGYFLWDEPGAGAFPTIGQTVEYLHEKDPAHPSYLNILPNFCPVESLGTPSYEAYVDRFIQQVKPGILSYDHYHFMSHFDRPGFIANLQTVQAASMKHDVPFWQIVLLINHFDYRSPTEAELRYEAMQTLVYGGKGLMWFTYWQPGKDWGQAMITLNGEVTPKYEQAKHVNKLVQVLGKELLHASVIRTIEIGTPGDLTNAGLDQPFTVAEPNLTLGYFRRGKGERLAMVANRDYQNAVSTELQIAGATGALQKLDKTTGTWADVSSTTKGPAATVAIKLDPADADLYRWQVLEK